MRALAEVHADRPTEARNDLPVVNEVALGVVKDPIVDVDKAALAVRTRTPVGALPMTMTFPIPD
jgi:hypothetical protein